MRRRPTRNACYRPVILWINPVFLSHGPVICSVQIYSKNIDVCWIFEPARTPFTGETLDSALFFALFSEIGPLETGSQWTASATIQAYETANPCGDSGWAVSVGIFARVSSALLVSESFRPILAPCLRIQKFRSPRGRPSTAETVRNLGILEDLGGTASSPIRNYCGFNPRASNCLLHSAGASRNRSTPMPRGN